MSSISESKGVALLVISFTSPRDNVASAHRARMILDAARSISLDGVLYCREGMLPLGEASSSLKIDTADRFPTKKRFSAGLLRLYFVVRKCVATLFDFDKAFFWALKGFFPLARLIFSSKTSRHNVWILATAPQMSAVYLGLALSKITGANLATDIRDVPSRAGDGNFPWLTQISMRCSKIISASSWTQLQLVRESSPGASHLLTLNGIATDISGISSFSAHPHQSSLVFYYAGSLYDGQRPIAMAVGILGELSSALALIGLDPVSLLISGRDNYLAPNLRTGALKIEVTPHLSRPDTLRRMLASNFNLILQGESEEHVGAIPLKTFELMAIGKPIIYFGPVGSDTVRLLKEYCVAPFFIAGSRGDIGAITDSLHEWVIEHRGCAPRPTTQPSSRAMALQLLEELQKST